MNRSTHSKNHGLALVELLVASTVALMVLAGTMVTFSAVQRSFLASLYQVNAQGDQNRVFSYLRRDLRGASAVQLAAGGTQLTVTLPAPAKPSLNTNLGAALLSLLMPPQSVSGTKTVRYYRQGTSILREEGSTTVELSSSATQFVCTQQSGVVRVEASFQPRFSFGAKVSAGAASKAAASVRLLNIQS